jgi:hypothetical protein
MRTDWREDLDPVSCGSRNENPDRSGLPSLGPTVLSYDLNREKRPCCDGNRINRAGIGKIFAHRACPATPPQWTGHERYRRREHQAGDERHKGGRASRKEAPAIGDRSRHTRLNDRRQKKPTQQNPEDSGFNCVGLLTNGSSSGGWITLYLAFRRPRNSAGSKIIEGSTHNLSYAFGPAKQGDRGNLRGLSILL